MKKGLIGVGVALVLILVLLVWLAGSVGPDTAPSELQTRELTLPTGT